MKNLPGTSVGCFTFVLQAHLPYVLHHGTWPHGLEWLLEAATETYLPLLRTVRRLREDDVPFCAHVSLSPVLLEQLGHPDFRAELPQYLRRKVVAAQEDAAFFEQAGEHHLLSLARHWESVFRASLAELDTLDGDICRGFRAAEEAGALQLLTSAATHSYAPLLGTDESLRAQFRTAVVSHRSRLGCAPAGVWLPECGYRPACNWRFPVPPAGATGAPEEERMGVETALEEAGLPFTFVDAHLLEDATGGNAGALYRPHTIAESGVAVFARDPRSALQVWSAQYGYPGDFAYLDFHKKRWPGGHRYWRVTGAGLGMEAKQPYVPEDAAERVRVHAEHFAGLIAETLRSVPAGDCPPILCAPFDLELFGHWWHEGALFLEAVARVLARGEHGVQCTTCSSYLQSYGAGGAVHMHEGSWGAGGDSSVWCNSETAGLLSRVYSAELRVREASAQDRWTDGAEGQRLAEQMCRELMLMESSDWPSLITTGAARDYAERRFEEHASAFDALHEAWDCLLQTGSLSPESQELLTALQQQDGIFAALNPADWKRSPPPL